MAMNREQKRAMQKAGQVNADGSQVATRDRKAPAQRLKSERTRPVRVRPGGPGRAEEGLLADPARRSSATRSIVLIALVVFTAFVFVVDLAFGEFFRQLLDPGPPRMRQALRPPDRRDAV